MTKAFEQGFKDYIKKIAEAQQPEPIDNQEYIDGAGAVSPERWAAMTGAGTGPTPQQLREMEEHELAHAGAYKKPEVFNPFENKGNVDPSLINRIPAGAGTPGSVPKPKKGTLSPIGRLTRGFKSVFPGAFSSRPVSRPKPADWRR